MPHAPFAGRTVVVTGGGTGIGRATALAFAEQGAAVLVTGRRKERLAETAAAHSRWMCWCTTPASSASARWRHWT